MDHWILSSATTQTESGCYSPFAKQRRRIESLVHLLQRVEHFFKQRLQGLDIFIVLHDCSLQRLDFEIDLSNFGLHLLVTCFGFHFSHQLLDVQVFQKLLDLFVEVLELFVDALLELLYVELVSLIELVHLIGTDRSLN